MDTLSLTAACMLCVAQPAQSPSVTRWAPLIAQASPAFDVPAIWIERVMLAESGGRTTLNGAPITSNLGAMGLMQLMPGTYAQLRRRYGFGANPYDPKNNIFAGAAYLHELYRHYGYPLLFAAYEAGPQRVDAWLFERKALPEATLRYVARIVPGVHLTTGTANSRPDSGRRGTKNRDDEGPIFVRRMRSLHIDFASEHARKSDGEATSSLFMRSSGGENLFVPLALQNR